MKRNRMAVAALASVLAAVAGALAFANNSESVAPTADAMKNGALTAMRAAGGEWATMDRGTVAGSWNARVLRADGSIADVRMDDHFHVVGVDGATPSPGVPAPAQAGIDDDRETPVPASDAARAGKAALDAVGGGTVESVDRDREGGATWEVEVTKTDGTRADVLLDGQFRLISVGGEQEPNEGPDDASDDDHGQPDD